MIGDLRSEHFSQAEEVFRDSKVGLSALRPAAGANTLVAENGAGSIVGIASYRVTADGAKICNIAAAIKRCGYGTELVKEIRRRTGLPIWCQSSPDAKPFYAALGMEECEQLPDGRTIFRDPA